MSEIIDIDSLENNTSVKVYSSSRNRRVSDTDQSMLTFDELAFLNNLAVHTHVEVGGSRIEGITRTFSPLGLSGLQKTSCKNYEISAMGTRDLVLENLSVLSDGVKPILGAGTRLATEWWIKYDGYEVITIRFDSEHFVIYYSEGWCIAPCNQMLYEGAELIGNTLMIREDLIDPFRVVGCKWIVKPVKKHNFNVPIPSNIEGIMMMVDFQMYRLKELHTIDLLYKDSALLDSIGGKVFDCKGPFECKENSIVEVDLEGNMLRVRGDKTRPDSPHKIGIIRNLKTLQVLRNLLSHLELKEDLYYVPTQWAGYSMLDQVKGKPEHVSRNVFHQIMSIDQVKLIEEWRRREPQHVMMDDFYNRSYEKFSFVSMVKTIIRNGQSFNVWDLRKFLIQHGVWLKYDQYYVTSAYKNSCIAVDSLIVVPTQTYVLDKCNVVFPTHIPEDVYPSIGYYNTSLALSLKDRIANHIAHIDQPLFTTLISKMIRLNFLPKGDILTVLKCIILNILYKKTKCSLVGLHEELCMKSLEVSLYVLEEITDSLMTYEYVHKFDMNGPVYFIHKLSTFVLPPPNYKFYSGSPDDVVFYNELLGWYGVVEKTKREDDRLKSTSTTSLASGVAWTNTSFYEDEYGRIDDDCWSDMR